MWPTVLVLGLLTLTDPARLVIAVVLVSRPRALHNLFAYWLGGMTAAVVASLGALILLHNSLAMVIQDVTSRIAIFTGHIQIVFGVLALLIAALVSAGFPARQHAAVPTSGGAPPAPVLQPARSTISSRLAAWLHHALESGDPRIAFAAGVVSATPPIEFLVVLTTIVSSGATIGSQLSAVVIFTVVVLALIEVPLLSYVAMPAKTQAAMVQLQDWVRAHARRIFVITATVGGVLLLTIGMGSL